MVKNSKYLLLLSVSFFVFVSFTSFSVTTGSSIAQDITSAGGSSLLSKIKGFIPVIVSRATLEKIKKYTQFGAEETSVLENAYKRQFRELEVSKRSGVIRGTLVVAFGVALLAQNAYWHRRKIAHAYRSVISSENKKQPAN